LSESDLDLDPVLAGVMDTEGNTDEVNEGGLKSKSKNVPKGNAFRWGREMVTPLPASFRVEANLRQATV